MGPEDSTRQPAPTPHAPQPSRATRAIPRRGLLRRVFRENLGLKLTSMILAVALLFIVRQDQGKEVDIEVPVVLSDKADSDVFVGELPKVLRVRVRDRWSRLARALERKASPYLVDLRGFSNESIYVFDRERIQLLLGVSGLSIQSVYPSQVAVKTEPKVEMMIPVRPNLVGEVPEGYMVARDKTRTTPAELKVWGARSSVQQVGELTTHPIDLGPLDKAARLEVLVQKPALPFLFMDQDRVQVEVPVAEIEGKVTVGASELVVRNCAEGLDCTLDPPSIRLTLQGPMPVLLRLERRELPIEVFVDAADFEAAPGRHVGVRPACDRPQGIECIMTPRTVTLTVAKEAPDGDDSRRPAQRTR